MYSAWSTVPDLDKQAAAITTAGNGGHWIYTMYLSGALRFLALSHPLLNNVTASQVPGRLAGIDTVELICWYVNVYIITSRSSFKKNGLLVAINAFLFKKSKSRIYLNILSCLN